MGAFEQLLAALGQMVEERDGFKLYKSFGDGTFLKEKDGGYRSGKTKAGEGVKIVIMVDANGLPITFNTASASPHESTLVDPFFDFTVTVDFPERIIGDKAYHSDNINARMREIGVG